MRRAPGVLLGVLLAGLGWAAPGRAADDAPPYQRQHGAARLVLEGGTVQDGKVQVPFAGVLRVVLTVEGRRGLEVEPVKEITASDGWTARPTRAPETTALAGDRVGWRQEFTLEPMKPSVDSVALAPLRYREGNGAWETATWEPIPVQVTKQVSGADLKQLHDIRPPIRPPEPPPWPRWPLGVGAAVVAAGLAVVVWRLTRRRKPARVPLSPPEWALRELDRLEALDLPAKGETNLYHTLLSDTVRRYLERRFQLPASHQTTAEFFRAVEDSDQLTPAQRDLLRVFFQRCDMAKFARVVPSPDECAAVAAQARSFVADTSAPAAVVPAPA